MSVPNEPGSEKAAGIVNYEVAVLTYCAKGLSKPLLDGRQRDVLTESFLT